MNCKEVRDILREGRPVEGAAATHIGGCPSCARESAIWRDLRSALRAPVIPPPFLHARIMAGVRAEARALAERGPWYAALWVRRWALPSLAAAALFVGQGVGIAALFRPVPDDLVVRWSEEQAILLARNAAPLRPELESLDLSASKPEALPRVPPRLDLAQARDKADRSTPGLSGFAPEPSPPPVATSRPGGPPAAGRRSDEPESPPPLELAQLRGRQEAPSTAAAEASSLRDESDSTGDFSLESEKEKGSVLRSQVGGAPPAQGGLAKSGAAPAPASAAPGKRTGPATVSCRLARQGAQVARVEISASAAPSPGEPYSVEVDASGRITSVRPVPTSPAALASLEGALSRLGLPEGTYTLSR